MFTPFVLIALRWKRSMIILFCKDYKTLMGCIISVTHKIYGLNMDDY